MIGPRLTRTLITGAAGFTGRYLSSFLADNGHEVHGIVHAIPAYPVAGVATLHQGDVANPTALDEFLAVVRPDHVVHLAGIAFVGHHNLGEMYRTNIFGTRELLAALARLSAPPRSILIASSSNVYGNSRDGVLDESMPLAPANDYGVTKVALELLAKIYADRLPIITVRPFNYVGRGQSIDFVIPKIIDQVRRRAPEIALGNLDVARDFSDVRGVARAYARLLETPAAAGATFNVCSGKAISLGDVLEMVRKLSGHEFQVRVNPAFVRPDEVKSLCGTAARLEQLIGPLNMPPLEETLHWMLEE